MKKSKTNIKKGGGKTCSNILTPKQVGPICWFMATFVAMFYSQRSRKLLIEASKHWDENKQLFKLFKFILNHKYKKISSRDKTNYEYFYTEFVYFILLFYLNKENNIKFPYDPSNVNRGFAPDHYIGQLYNLLKIDNSIYEYNTITNILAYSYLNKEFDNIFIRSYIYSNSQLNININYRIDYNLYNNLTYKDFKYIPPSILIIIIENENGLDYNKFLNKNIINDEIIKKSLISMNENITYMNVKYNLDSVILCNWNKSSIGGHAIAGITCKKKHYVYNGWARSSMDPAMGTQVIGEFPCELMKYDWDIKNNSDFCLNPTECIPEPLKHKLKNEDLCFNFNKGKRILIYVRDDINTPQSSSSLNLSSQNLSSRNLSSQNLSSRNLSSQNLSSRNLSSRNLSSRNLSSRNLSSRNLSSRNLSSQLFQRHAHLRSSKQKRFSLTPMPSLHEHEPFSMREYKPTPKLTKHLFPNISSSYKRTSI